MRWIFEDPVDSTTAIFNLNPLSGGTPKEERKLVSHNTVAAGGRTVLMEGSKAPRTITFSGNISDEEQYNIYVTWFNKRHQIQLTDDLGREYMIMITRFSPRRVRRGNRFWRHSFDVEATVVDWP